MLTVANDEEADLIISWQFGVESRSGGPEAKFDFVPSKNAPGARRPSSRVSG
jgi:hypothetical protein